jgi:hypothetical protein
VLGIAVSALLTRYVADFTGILRSGSRIVFQCALGQLRSSLPDAGTPPGAVGEIASAASD